MTRKKMIIALALALLAAPMLAMAAAPMPPAKTDKCPVCGMFVAKYPKWVASITTDTGQVLYFDGAKDMFAYYFQPERFVKTPAGRAADIYVTDYYTVTPVDAKTAFFVVGSDVYGPMGHEFIAFTEKPAAENFLTDHKGNKLLTFDQVTAAMVEQMRSGMKMKMHMGH